MNIKRGTLHRHQFAISMASAAAAFFCLASNPGVACGYEDPQSIAMGALNLAFPDSLHLRTAIWQAQIDGVLPREPATSAPPATTRSFAVAIAPTSGSTEQTVDPAQVIALMDALRVIEQARVRLAGSAEPEHRPPVSMVYASKMLWTRFVPTSQGVSAQTHASGPEAGDVVLITEPSVIQALVTGSLTPNVAISRKLLRFYGDETATANAQQWVLALAPASAIKITKE